VLLFVVNYLKLFVVISTLLMFHARITDFSWKKWKFIPTWRKQSATTRKWRSN